MRYEILHADCRDVLANMGDGTVDSIVTDPPYHLTSIVKRFGKEGSAPAQFGTDGAYARASRGFMGKEWDGGDIAFDPELWAECLRVLKPGGHLLAFSGSRTYHRMAYAIDLAGFEIRDQLLWLYGSGFPKSHDVSKAIDKAAGAEREIVGERTLTGNAAGKGRGGQYANGAEYVDKGASVAVPVTAPATPEAQQWEGWGTALKPAHEPIVLARKPLDGTVAANVLAYGTGALNIDACRVPGESKPRPASNAVGGIYGDFANDTPRSNDLGRFPANVLHDGSDAIVRGFPETAKGSGEPRAFRKVASGADASGNTGAALGAESRPSGSVAGVDRNDGGSAARFFYCAKASKADREAGCAIFAEAEARGNPHPTVKPTELMRWLVRLVTPPGGLVFDPFTGSGSTGRAAMLEGFRFLGAEMTDEYVPIAHARILDALD